MLFFYDYRNKLFSFRYILQFGAAPCAFIFVVLSSLDALFAFFSSTARKMVMSFPRSSTIF